MDRSGPSVIERPGPVKVRKDEHVTSVRQCCHCGDDRAAACRDGLCPAGAAWKKYLYAQDAVQQGKLDTNMLNQMSALVSAQGLRTLPTADIRGLKRSGSRPGLSGPGGNEGGFSMVL
jgi:hypothetical protein